MVDKTLYGSWSDVDAALTFCLRSIFEARRVNDLVKLVRGEGVDVLVGDPGWAIERRGDLEDGLNEQWPAHSRFRAYVDPDEFWLEHPECFVDERTFMGYVTALSTTYYVGGRNESHDLRQLESLSERHGTMHGNE